MSRSNGETLAEVVAVIESRCERDGECLIWTGCISGSPTRASGGVPQVRWRGKTHGPNRLVYEHRVGPIPPGHNVQRSCGRDACLAPEHLVAVPSGAVVSESVRERISHGTRGRGAKLSPAQVRHVRRLRATGKPLPRGLARRWGVTYGTIQFAAMGRTYAYLPGAVRVREHEVHRCSICGGTGHNRRTCTAEVSA